MKVSMKSMMTKTLFFFYIKIHVLWEINKNLQNHPILQSLKNLETNSWI